MIEKKFDFDILSWMENPKVKKLSDFEKKVTYFFNETKFSKLNKNVNCRVCIHKTKKASMHSMIVLINSNNEFKIHKHSKTSEIYQLIECSIKINLFKNNKKIKSVIMKKKGEIFSVLKNQLHIVVPVSNIAIFHETKLNEYK